MGVAKAVLLEPAEEIRVPVGKECMVIGGGIAGMNSALELADRGYNVNLIEKTERLGGILNDLDSLAPSDTNASEMVKHKVDQIEQSTNINVMTNTEIKDIKGYVGNYKVRVARNGKSEDLDVSTIIVASGMNEILPDGLFGYGTESKVVTQLQFEDLIKKNELGEVRSIVMINCVNSKNDMRGCCSIGCMTSIKNAKLIKQSNEEIKVHVLHRDLNFEGTNVSYLKEATRNHDIKLIRYPDDWVPEVSKGDEGLKVKVRDLLLGRELDIDADMVVLTTGFKGDESVEGLKGTLKVSVDTESFFVEAHEKLRPLDFASDGIYLSGCSRSPKGVKETVEEALGASMRAAIPMKRGYVEAEGIVGHVNPELCTPCKICSKTCAFGAVDLFDEAKPPSVIKALCKGCGSCAADCPRDAINIIHYGDGQIIAQVEAALEENPDEKIIAFCCHWCALGAVDIAGVSRFDYPPNIRIIRVMCAGRVDPDFIYRAFELKAAGVLVAGCEFPTCHYINGNFKCRDRLERVKKKLSARKVDVERLWTVWLSAADGPKFVSTVKTMTEQLGLGGHGL